MFGERRLASMWCYDRAGHEKHVSPAKCSMRLTRFAQVRSREERQRREILGGWRKTLKSNIRI